MDLKDARALLGLSRPAFARRYDIPVRTYENWELGYRTPPGWVVKLLVRVAQEDAETARLMDLARKYEAVEKMVENNRE